MMTLKEIRKKIKATKSIQKTVNVMQMISATRFQKTQTQLIPCRLYTSKIQQLLFSILLEKGSSCLRPFLIGNLSTTGVPHSKEGLLVVTSDKGLCGGYNTNTIKSALKLIKTKKIDDWEIFVVGAKGLNYFNRNGINVKHKYTDIFANFSFVEAETVTDEIVKVFKNLHLKRFSVVYSEYKSIFYQPVIVKQLLPILENKDGEHKFDYIYESSKENTVNKLIDIYIKAEVFRILLEARTSEFAFRRNAMESANKNSIEIIDDLSLTLGNLRQQRITTELSEIVGAG